MLHDEERTRRLTHDLAERVKELTLLHHTARLLQSGRPFDEAFLTDLVALFPGAWQYPEICEGRIAWEGMEVTTAGWTVTPWMLSAAIEAGGKTGVVEVAYREPRAADGGELFLPEERQLIRSIADMLGAHIGREHVGEALRQSEERLRAVIECTPNVGIQWYDEQGRVLFCNQASRRLFGWTDGSAIGRTLDQLNFSRSEAERFMATLRRVAATGESAGPMEFTFRRADGQEGVLLSTVFAIPLSSAGSCYVCMDVDLTDHRRVEEERRHVEAQLQQAQRIQSLGTLAGGIAHDFNNLLAAIAGHTALAMDALPEGHAVRENLTGIEVATRRATGVVRQILAFSRQQEPHPEPLHLQTVIDEAVRLLRATLPGLVAIRTHFDAATPGVRADSTQVHQVVMNLGTNAAHAIGARQGTIEIASEAAVVDARRVWAVPELTEGLYAHVTVRDDGSGMDSLTLGRIFEPFFTTKGAGHGTGLGMSVVHGIMKSHGGAVFVESELGTGTTVHLYFPASDHVPRVEPGARARTPFGRGEHILYVDDEEALVMLATRVLGRLGYRVTGCSDPVRAMQDFRANPAGFDAVVSDLSMPGLSGFEVARELLAIRPDLPVVLTSGVVSPDDAARARSLGVREVILKPNTTGELGDILHRLLSEQRAGES